MRSSRRSAATATVAVPALAWLLVCAAAPLAPGAIEISYVRIGDAGNPADATGLGAVDREYGIGVHEVTNGEYAAFLGAVAATDTNGLYNDQMAIARAGTAGSYSYTTAQRDLPVTHVSWYDAARFANWLHNGQPVGAQDPSTTEDGAYAFSGATQAGPRKPGAAVFLPSEDEWYKAAYYGGGTNGGYSLYPTRSDAPPAAATPGDGANLANYEGVAGGPTTAGSYVGSASFYGTLDQGGNVWEWIETEIETDRALRGGSFDDYPLLLQSWYRDSQNPADELPSIGFRVASTSGTTGEMPFRRGDINQDRQVNIADAVFLLSALFARGEKPRCESAADTNDDGDLNIADPIRLLSHLFARTGPLPAPFTSCWYDFTPDSLTCETFDPCAGAR